MNDFVDRNTSSTFDSLQFELLESNSVSEDNRSILMYGIGVKSFHADFTHNFTELTHQKDRVVGFIEKCKSNDVSPIHIQDLVDDFLSDLYGY